MQSQEQGHQVYDGGDSFAGLDEGESKKAVEIIQRTYRGHRARRQLQGFELNASTRWYEAISDAQFKRLTTPAPRREASISPELDSKLHENGAKNEPFSSARQNWRRATGVAKRAGRDDRTPSLSEASSEAPSDREGGLNTLSQQERRKIAQRRAETKAQLKQNAKMMDLQYFLELVDHKHRYGSNLRKYHAHWKSLDTNQNYFYWLDQGDGRKVSLPECSRTRLDSEQVRYLSREERLNYLVRVDKEGRLVWAKNGEKVWTKDELYKDSITGIVSTSDPTPKFKYNIPPDNESPNSSSEDEDDLNEEKADSLDRTGGDEGERYVNEDFHQVKGPAKIKYVSAATLFNHMIRTSMKKGHKWIFVADTSFRLYIGYKQSGAFQHSSFLHGSRITAAGLIKVKHGQLRSLSPLSGHYRPPAANFRAFVHSLRDEGIDMSRVNISKSYAVLVGMESYTRTRKKIKETEEKARYETNKIFNPEKARKAEEAKQDKSKSAEKERAYLQRQQQEQQQSHQYRYRHRPQSKDGQEDDHSKRRSLSNRFSSVLGRFNNQDHNPNSEQGSEGRSVPGFGPEDGVPAPEGKR